jgi:hypothetical protein
MVSGLPIPKVALTLLLQRPEGRGFTPHFAQVCWQRFPEMGAHAWVVDILSRYEGARGFRQFGMCEGHEHYACCGWVEGCQPLGKKETLFRTAVTVAMSG